MSVVSHSHSVLHSAREKGYPRKRSWTAPTFAFERTRTVPKVNVSACNIIHTCYSPTSPVAHFYIHVYSYIMVCACTHAHAPCLRTLWGVYVC